MPVGEHDSGLESGFPVLVQHEIVKHEVFGNQIERLFFELGKRDRFFIGQPVTAADQADCFRLHNQQLDQFRIETRFNNNSQFLFHIQNFFDDAFRSALFNHQADFRMPLPETLDHFMKKDIASFRWDTDMKSSWLLWPKACRASVHIVSK